MGRAWAWLLVLGGIAGLIVGVVLFDRSSPSAAIRLDLDRGEVLSRAAAFLAAIGEETDDYRTAIRFVEPSETLRYVEKTLGIEETNRLLRGGVRLHRWEVRFFRPGEKTEFTVGLTPGGMLVLYEKIVPEDEPGGALGELEAEGRAREFLRSFAPVDAGALERIESGSTARPSRADVTITFRDGGSAIAEAEHRFDVWFLGDRLGGFNEYYQVPEAFTRDGAALDALRSAVQTVADYAHTALEIAMLIVFLVAVRRGCVPWEMSLAAGAALAGVEILSHANSLGLWLHSYDPVQSYGSFLTGFATQGVTSAAYEGLGGLVLAGAALGLARMTGDGRGLGEVLLGPGSPPSVGRGVATGYGLAGVMFGYVTLFYLAGQEWLGFFVPLTVNYDDTLSTRLPWAYPLGVGVSASLTEELMYRLFAIEAVRRLTRSSVLAVLLPAAAWGFGHTFYDVEPVYARGIEVGGMGLVLGWAYLRFGLLPCLVWHYAYDAGLVGQLLLRSGNPTFLASGVAVVGLAIAPVFLAWPGVRRWIGRRLEAGHPEGGPLAASETGWSPPPAQRPPAPLAWFGYALGLASLALPFVWTRFENPGATVGEVRLTRAQALQRAEEWLATEGFDTADYRRVDELEIADDGWDAVYLSRMNGARTARGILDDAGAGRPVWLFRWFRPQDEHALAVAVDQEGRITRFEMGLPENEQGASLSLTEARALARAAAERWRPDLRPDEWEESHTSYVRPARTDYDIWWTRRGGELAEAEAHLHVGLAGDRIARLDSHVEAPERFIDDASRVGPIDHVVGLTGDLGGMIKSGAAMLAAVIQLRAGRFDLRMGLLLGGAVLVLRLLGLANAWPVFWAGYADDTAASPFLYLYQSLADDLMAGGWSAFVTFLLIGAGWRARPWSRRGAGGAPLALALRIAISIGLTFTAAYLFGERWPGHYLQLFAYSQEYNTYSPLGSAALDAVSRGIGLIGVVGVFATLAEWRPRGRSLWVALYFLVAACDAWRAGASAGLHVADTATAVLPDVLALACLLRFGGFDRRAIFLLGAAPAWLSGLSVLEGPGLWWRANGAACVIALALMAWRMTWPGNPSRARAQLDSPGAIC